MDGASRQVRDAASFAKVTRATPEQIADLARFLELLTAWNANMNEVERRRWNSWDDFMREWCRREHFVQALPLLLRGEDPQFQEYIRHIAVQEHGNGIQPSSGENHV